VHVLHRKILRPDASGLPIPHSLKSLSQNEIEIRRGELSVIFAVAGMGKSQLALNIAVSCGLPTLYVSADTNSRNQAIRTLSCLTGRLQSDMDVALDDYRPWCARELKKVSHIRWVFDSAPSMDDLETELLAFIEMFGEPPALLVIDNATDVVMEGAGDPWESLRELFRSLKFLAREHQTAVLALHHANEEDPNYARSQSICPPRARMQGRASQVPALILSMASDDGWMAVCPVKNRNGVQDPSGGNVIIALDWDPARVFVADSERGRL